MHSCSVKVKQILALSDATMVTRTKYVSFCFLGDRVVMLKILF